MEIKFYLFLILFLTLFFSCKEKTQADFEIEKKDVEIEHSEKKSKPQKLEKNIEIDKSELGEDLAEINCYVKNIYQKDNSTYVDIDLVEVILTPEGERTIINKNPKIRTYLVNHKTIIYLHDCKDASPEELLKMDKQLLEDKSIIVVGSSKDGVLESMNFGCYG